MEKENNWKEWFEVNLRKLIADIGSIGYRLLTDQLIGAPKNEQFCYMVVYFKGITKSYIIGNIPFNLMGNENNVRPEHLITYEETANRQMDQLVTFQQNVDKDIGLDCHLTCYGEVAVKNVKCDDSEESMLNIIIAGPEGGFSEKIANIAIPMIKPFCDADWVEPTDT